MKEPFSPTGMQALLTTLYQLPDEDLQLAAADLAADLRVWLDQHFFLSAAQLQYLAEVDNRQIAEVAAAGLHFVSNRLPITLIKDEAPMARRDSEGKFFDLKREKNSSYSDTAGYTEEEHLTIHIYYS